MTPREKLFSVLHPQFHERAEHVKKNNKRFVHYTSAEVALSIIDKREVWMRKSTMMNDSKEILHGRKCLESALASKSGKTLESCLSSVFPKIFEEIQEQLRRWAPVICFDTYLTCISEHEDVEDEHGRLSMWRAYGQNNGVAIVMKNSPFLEDSDALRIYTSPVAYLTESQFESDFQKICINLENIKDDLGELDEDTVKAYLFNSFQFAMICTKHPGFLEEKEWRLIYCPKNKSIG